MKMNNILVRVARKLLSFKSTKLNKDYLLMLYQELGTLAERRSHISRRRTDCLIELDLNSNNESKSKKYTEECSKLRVSENKISKEIEEKEKKIKEEEQKFDK